MDESIFAVKLKAARKLLKLSQAQIAEATGLLQKDVSNIENGTRQYIPIQYISFLQKQGIDIRMLYDLSKESIGFNPNGPQIDYTESGNIDKILRGKSKLSNDSTIQSFNSENVDLKSRPISRPISKSENLGLQKDKYIGLHVFNDPAVLYPENLIVDIVDVRAAANMQGLSLHEGHIDTLGNIPVPRSLLGRSTRKKYFWFPVVGDSMEPTIYVGDYILASLVEPGQYDTIKDNYLYIVSTTNGIVVKRILNRLDSRGQLYAKSDNRSYSGYNIDQSEIVSVWFAQARMSFKFPNEQIDLFNAYKDLESRIETLERKK